MKTEINLSIEVDEDETGNRMDELMQWCMKHKLPYYMTFEKSNGEGKNDLG